MKLKCFRRRIMSFNEKYYGAKCPVCKEKLDGKSDIAVCPDCGTPYHKECYLKVGHCVNDELHASGKSWEPEAAKLKSSGIPLPYGSVSAEFRPDAQAGYDYRQTPQDIGQFNTPRPSINNNNPTHDSRPLMGCPKCGNFNPAEFSYCSRCGYPVGQYYSQHINMSMQNPGMYNNAGQQSPYNDPANSAQNGQFVNLGQLLVNLDDPYCGFDPASDIGGATVSEMSSYVDTNTFYFLPLFKRMNDTGHRLSWNFSAMLFPVSYFAYRKMYLYSFVALLFRIIIFLPTIVAVLSSPGIELGELSVWLKSVDLQSNSFLLLKFLSDIFNYTFMFVTGGYANYLYYRKSTGNITAIKSKGIKSPELDSSLRHKGGTNITLVLVIVSAAVIALFSLVVLGASLSV